VSALEPGDEVEDLGEMTKEEILKIYPNYDFDFVFDEMTKEELYQEQLEIDEWYAQQRYESEEYKQMLLDQFLKGMAEGDKIEEQTQKFIDNLPEEVVLILFFVDLEEVVKAVGIKVDSDSKGNNTPTPTTSTPTTSTPTTSTPTKSKFYVFTEYGDGTTDFMVSSPLGDFYESGGDNKYYWMDTTLPDGTPTTILLNLPVVTANTILDSDIVEVIEVTKTMVSSELVDPVDVISIHLPDMDPSPSIIPLLDTTPPLTKSIIIPSTTPLMPPFTTPFTSPSTTPSTTPFTTSFTTPFTGDKIPNTSQVGPERPIGNFVTDSNYDDGSHGAFDQEVWSTVNDDPLHRWFLINDPKTFQFYWDGGPFTMSDPFIRNPGGYVMLDPSGNTIFKEQKVATMEEYMYQAPRIISCNPGAPTSGAITIMPDGEILGTCPTSPIGTGQVSQPSRPNTAPPVQDALAYHTYARTAGALTGGTPYGGFESAASQDAALQEAIAVSITNYPLSFR